MSKVIVVTGGAGFIGSALVRYLLTHTPHTVVNVDKLTYAGNLESLEPVAENPRHIFVRSDITDRKAMEKLFSEFEPHAVMHLAAESHVDRSISSADDFIQTNLIGTFALLEAARKHWATLPAEAKNAFRFLHVSTDEVFGTLGKTGVFTEETPYQPNSPYSASKAGSDHLVRAWYHTYGLPTLITNCSNNYGPYQFPEKLIPVAILNAKEGKPIPVYGTGENVRDWLYVDDHVRALVKVLENGAPGQTYNVGSRNERTNLELVETMCSILDELCPHAQKGGHRALVTFVADRPGHDLRYAIDPQKIETELGWKPEETFESGLRKTVRWYLENASWCQKVLNR